MQRTERCGGLFLRASVDRRHNTSVKTTWPLLVLVSAGLGCGSATAHPRPPQSGPPKTSQVETRCNAGVRSLVSRDRAYGAFVRRRAVAYRRPGRGRIATFGRRNANGAPNVFGVLAVRVTSTCERRWLRVKLPMRPNGVAGWVRARDVRLLRVRTSIEVDVSARRVTLFRRGRRVLTATAAVGSAATPTPIGRFYVNQRLIPADSHGPFGPGAVGISAFSNVLTGWTQGGPIAIHGTNQPWSIGRPVSNGCIRLPNPVLRRVFAAALPGTPVVIHP